MELAIHDLNLIMTDNWYELISGIELDMQQEMITLAPYQTVWISNVFHK